MLLLTLILVLILGLLFLNMKQPQPQPQTIIVSPETRDPEFRSGPYKNYKPRRFQQVGVLLGTTGDILPLYGRESPTYRNRYNYYTTTPGQQIYSLKVTYQNRDCSEDIGCPELYGGEQVTVLGKTGTYTTDIYETIPTIRFYP